LPLNLSKDIAMFTLLAANDRGTNLDARILRPGENGINDLGGGLSDYGAIA
jgi:hypothetical protein